MPSTLQAGPTVELIPLRPDTTAAPMDGTAWLITYPPTHRLQHQYVVTAVQLQEMPDLEPPRRNFPGATHELAVLTLRPAPALAGGYWPAAALAARQIPVIAQTIAIQTDGTVLEMTAVTARLAHLVETGALTPDLRPPPRTAAAVRTALYQAHAAAWLTAARRALEDVRQREVHIR